MNIIERGYGHWSEQCCVNCGLYMDNVIEVNNLVKNFHVSKGFF